MKNNEYMSGDELYRFLHISKRKMKYLIDNNYIPCEISNQKTHRYCVKQEDAEKFKMKMETQVGFLAELTGMFSNRTEWHPRPLLEVTDENCEMFYKWLKKEWAELPDALPSKDAAKLIGVCPQRIYELIKNGTLRNVKIVRMQYVLKDDFIKYLSSPEKLAKPTTQAYKDLIIKFKERLHREKWNRKRREQRRSVKK